MTVYNFDAPACGGTRITSMISFSGLDIVIANGTLTYKGQDHVIDAQTITVTPDALYSSGVNLTFALNQSNEPVLLVDENTLEFPNLVDAMRDGDYEFVWRWLILNIPAGCADLSTADAHILVPL